MQKQNFVSIKDNNLFKRGINPNLKGMYTQFGNNFGIDNKIIDNNVETYKKYDIIPDKGIKSDIINKPFKLILNFDQSNIGNPIILNEPYRDVVSVKLINGIIREEPTDDTTDASLFITLSINELNNIRSSKTPDGGELNDCFAALEYDKTIDIDRTSENDATTVINDKFNIYKNRFGVNQDIRYFDPPLNSLAQLNINLYTDAHAAIGSFKCKLELMIETKEKLRVYN